MRLQQFSGSTSCNWDGISSQQLFLYCKRCCCDCHLVAWYVEGGQPCQTNIMVGPVTGRKHATSSVLDGPNPPDLSSWSGESTSKCTLFCTKCLSWMVLYWIDSQEKTPITAIQLRWCFKRKSVHMLQWLEKDRARSVWASRFFINPGAAFPWPLTKSDQKSTWLESFHVEKFSFWSMLVWIWEPRRPRCLGPGRWTKFFGCHKVHYMSTLDL